MKCSPIIIPHICRSFVVKLGTSIWLRLLTEVRSSPGTVALASFLVCFLERDAFASHTFVVQSTTRHLVQQMGTVYTWNSGARTISAFSTSAWIYLCFTSERAFVHSGYMHWAVNMWKTAKLKTEYRHESWPQEVSLR